MIKTWKLFNENKDSEEFRYSESELLDVISDLLDDNLVQDLNFKMLYYNKGQQLSREKLFKYGVNPEWKNRPLYMFTMTLTSPDEFIPIQGVYFDDIESFKKIYQILGSIKSWAKREDLTFLHKLHDRNLKLLFIQND